MKLVALILIVLGLVGLLYGGFTYIKDRDTADLGIAEVTITDKERVQIHPALGGVLLAVGIVVLVWGGRRKLAT